jgi:hypothetical protein
MRAKAASINTPEGLTEPADRTFTVAGHVLTRPKAARVFIWWPPNRQFETLPAGAGNAAGVDHRLRGYPHHPPAPDPALRDLSAALDLYKEHNAAGAAKNLGARRRRRPVRMPARLDLRPRFTSRASLRGGLMIGWGPSSAAVGAVGRGTSPEVFFRRFCRPETARAHGLRSST